MDLRHLKDSEERRRNLEDILNLDLSDISQTLIDKESDIHCENLIGAISLPLGIAGPLKVKFEDRSSDHFIPLATTEGALVASVSRGVKTINLAGGAVVDVKRVGATRGPVFETSGILQSRKLEDFIKKNKQKISEVAESTSHHLKLKDIKISINGKYVYLRIIYHTDEAMGMNMVTIATTKITKFIEENTEASCIAVAGNFDVDKKPSMLNFIDGRGFIATAEIILKSSIVKNNLKTTVDEIVKVVEAKCLGGSIMSGSIGYNAHFANIVAAIFLATGQDAAHVVEGSLGITTAEKLKNGDLYFSVYLPSLMLGTVGGGTKLKTQSLSRKISDTKTSKQLAASVAGGVLAGELSLLGSIAENTLAKSHEKLGR